VIDSDIYELHCGRSGSGAGANGIAAVGDASAPSGYTTIKKSIAIFSAPYFKDVNLFSHPPNADTMKKRDNGELDVFLGNPREWTPVEKKKLEAAVR
jgi:hypothetical protein